MKNTRDVYDDLLDMAKREANHKSLPTDVIFRVFNTVDSGLLSFLKDGKTVLYVYSNKHGSGDYNIGTPDIEKWMALAFAAAGIISTISQILYALATKSFWMRWMYQK